MDLRKLFIVFIAVSMLVSISGFASANSECASNTIEESSPLGKNISSFVWENYENIDWTSSAKLLDSSNISHNSTNKNSIKISQLEKSNGDNHALVKEKYIDKILEMDEFKNYSKNELEKIIVPYSDISSNMIETIYLEKYPMTLDIESFDEGNVMKMSSTISYDLNQSSSDKRTISTTATVPNVIITNVNCDWSWVQNEIALQTITIHNYGTTTAKGAISIVSLDENQGYVLFYENLVSGQDGTVTIPFYVDKNTFPTVGEKPISIRAYVQSGEYFYLTSAPTISVPMVEMYSNEPGELEDPDDGVSLELDDLNHHDQYEIARRAASAGDGTSTPYQTASAVLTQVHNDMNYNESILSPLYTGADIWIIENGFNGICDEYAVLYESYLRALGIPTRRIGIFFTVNNLNTAHQFNELWDGSTWIHADSKGNLFSTPRRYTDVLGWDITQIFVVHGANDSLSQDDGPDNDDILHSISDMSFSLPDGLEDRYC
jgi:Transglutaminase-like enzymes, putative cysteine proteases